MSQPCGGGSITIFVKVQASGDIIIVDVDVEGSVAVTIESPAECPRSYVWHSGEIHECGPRLEGWNCNPKGAKVRVKYYKIANPCPTIPTSLSELPGSSGAWET